MGRIRILGIDPGLRNAGWGVIESDGPVIRHIANGVCRSMGENLGARLVSLYDQLSEQFAAYNPDAAAVEQTFVNRDGAGTLKLGQARGVAMLVAARSGLTVGEYAPNTVKKTLTGVGHAAKPQIEAMLRLQLPGAKIAGPDAADALAVAICHLFHLQTAGRIRLQEVRA